MRDSWQRMNGATPLVPLLDISAFIIGRALNMRAQAIKKRKKSPAAHSKTEDVPRIRLSLWLAYPAFYPKYHSQTQ